MNKQLPYIHVYVGDELRETFGLPADAMGVQQRIKFFLHEVGGKVEVSWSELFRVTGADSIEKLKQILSKLQAKKIFTFSIKVENQDPEQEIIEILYQPYIDKIKLGELRAAAGSKGGKASTENKSKPIAKPIAKTEQNRDYDYDNDNDSEIKEGGVGEEKWNCNPSEKEKSIDLSEDEISNTIELLHLTKKTTLSPVRIREFWKAFKIQSFNGQEFYATRIKAIHHFRNWLKLNYGNSNASATKSKATASTGVENLQGLKRRPEEVAGILPAASGIDVVEQLDEWAVAELVNS